MAGDKKNGGVKDGKKPGSSSSSSSKSKKQQPQDDLSYGMLILQISVGIVVLSIAASFSYVYIMKDTVNVKFMEQEGQSPPVLSYPGNKWGSLRPGVYFGMKAMAPFSPVTGIMWFRNTVSEEGFAIRHWCSQWDRGIQKYGWIRHDFDSFGVQEILDDGIRLNTSFVVHDDTSWSARIHVNSLSVSIPSSLIFYLALDEQQPGGKNDTVSIGGANSKFPLDPKKSFTISGWSKSIGDYEARIYVEDKPENVLFKSFLATESHPSLVYLKETVQQNLIVLKNQNNLFVLKGDDDDISPSANFLAHQIILQGDAVIRIDFISSNPHDSSATASDDFSDEYKASLEEVQDIDFDESLSWKESKFQDSFERIFRLKSKGFSAKDISIAQAVVSNLMGGVGFFHGSNLVSSRSTPSTDEMPLKYGPHSHLTSVPSRSFFPRGFLWDEGFHNLLISRVNPVLSSNILKSWLLLMNIDGWIPREMILGKEAEERVPAEFLVQRSTNANPPTLFLTLESMMDQGSLFQDDLKELFPRLQAWYNWFNRTQVGSLEGSYRWRGRDIHAKELNPKTLTSGLDDYPRASHPNNDEYHVDLRSWMALASRVMARISFLLNDESQKDYKETADYLSDNHLLDSLHWSEEHGYYCDFGLHSKNVTLDKRVINQETGETDWVRTNHDEPQFGCVPEFGYVSIFPLVLQVLDPENPKVGFLLDKLTDPNLLWTDYGLRSLSKISFYYDRYNTESDAPYWRSNIWINVNYLTLKSLYFYGREKEGPFKDKAWQVYQKLRVNIMNNLIKQFQESNFIWENYSDKTGKGRGSFPFTGWSSLLVLIMAEKY